MDSSIGVFAAAACKGLNEIARGSAAIRANTVPAHLQIPCSQDGTPAGAAVQLGRDQLHDSPHAGPLKNAERWRSQ